MRTAALQLLIEYDPWGFIPTRERALRLGDTPVVESASSSVSGSRNLGRFVAFAGKGFDFSLALLTCLSHGSVLGIVILENRGCTVRRILLIWFTANLYLPDAAGGERAGRAPFVKIATKISDTSIMTEVEKTSAEAESLIPQFRFERLLNQDQAGRRVTLLGKIESKPALLTLERAAFPDNTKTLERFHASLTSIANLGANDIYHWYLASSRPTKIAPPDLKLNLIYPCTEQHIRKYSLQGVRMVTETPEIYAKYVWPYMKKKRDEGRLNWVYNIIEGRTEQEDVTFRYRGENEATENAFLMLPDLNWDRKTIASLHLLVLVERRDIWSLRDLKKKHIGWLQHMREMVLKATTELYPGLDGDMLKLYIHCAFGKAGYVCQS